MRTITIESGIYKAEILDQGAILHSFSIAGHDIICSFEDKEIYKNTKAYFGMVVGPFANRIASASYSDKNGKHVLEKNDGENNLHSASRNYGYQKWDVVLEEKDKVVLALESKESYGFPGNQKVEVAYGITDNGKLRLSYKIEGDKLCPVNPTNHAFFNLNGSGDVRDSVITLDCDKYIAVDSALIPLEITDVENTDFDFRKPTVLGKRRNGDYDHCFILNENGKVRVENDKYAIEMATNLPAFQLYTAGSMDREELGKNNSALSPFTAFCLESEYYPDFPNRDDFKGFWVDKDTIYESWTEYTLIKK